jgi:membrane protein implicated in regulation of membrane protease activity
MTGKGEISTLKAWLIVLVSFIDDAAILALVFLGLWFFKVKITWMIILIVALVMVAFVFIMHKAVIPSLRRRRVTGAEGMFGMTGTVTETCRPKGRVKIGDENWQAKSVEGNIDIGEDIEVVGIDRLVLEIKKVP